MSEDQSVDHQSKLKSVNDQLDQIHGALIDFKYKEENGRTKSTREMRANLNKIQLAYLRLNRATNLSESSLAQNIVMLFNVYDAKIKLHEEMEQQHRHMIGNLETDCNAITIHNGMGYIAHIGELPQALRQIDVMVAEVNALRGFGDSLTLDNRAILERVSRNIAAKEQHARRLLLDFFRNAYDRARNFVHQDYPRIISTSHEEKTSDTLTKLKHLAENFMLYATALDNIKKCIDRKHYMHGLIQIV